MRRRRYYPEYQSRPEMALSGILKILAGLFIIAIVFGEAAVILTIIIIVVYLTTRTRKREHNERR